MSKIRIIAAPPGQAPPWVREAWVGLEIPTVEHEASGDSVGVLDRERESAMNQGGYQVYGHDAIEALKAHDGAAAKWWLDNAAGAVSGTAILVFSRDVCELIP